MGLDKNTFVSMLAAYDSGCDKVRFIKKHYSSVSGLTIMDVAKDILPKMKDDHRAVEVAKFFKNWISRPEHLFAILSSLHDEYRIVDAIKKLYSKANLYKKDVINLLNYLRDDYRKGEIIKFFSNSFVSNDIPELISHLSDNYRKLEIIKLLCNKGKFDIDNILITANYMTEDEGRIKLAKLSGAIFITDPNAFLTFLQSMTTTEGKIQLIKNFTACVERLENPYEILLAEVTGDEHKLTILNVLKNINNLRAPQPEKIIMIFTDEKSKITALHRLSLKHAYSNVESLIELLQQFNGAGMKLKIFKRVLTESERLDANLLKALICFEKNDERIKAFSSFIATSTHLCLEHLKQVMENCESESRVKLLSLYCSKYELLEQELIQLLSLLPKTEKTVKFFKRHNYFTTTKELPSEWIELLKQYEKTTTDQSDAMILDDSDSDSDSDSEEEEEAQRQYDKELASKGIFIDRDMNIITISCETVKKNLDSMIQYCMGDLWKTDIQYHMKKKHILSEQPNELMSIRINGIDAIKASKDEIERIAKKVIKAEKKRKEQIKQKAQKLKVPHSCKDEKSVDSTPDEDICIICMSRLRRVILIPCGHYHTCAHCTRCIIRNDKHNNQCPLCNQEFTAVNPVF